MFFCRPRTRTNLAPHCRRWSRCPLPKPTGCRQPCRRSARSDEGSAGRRSTITCRRAIICPRVLCELATAAVPWTAAGHRLCPSKSDTVSCTRVYFALIRARTCSCTILLLFIGCLWSRHRPLYQYFLLEEIIIQFPALRSANRRWMNFRCTPCFKKSFSFTFYFIFKTTLIFICWAF